METLAAAVQINPETKNVYKNLEKAQQLVFEASAKGAKIVVLPELCLSGKKLFNVVDASDVAQTKAGYQTQAFANITKRFKNYVVFGYVQLEESKFYNSAAIIGPNGLVANVQKHNLSSTDLLWATKSLKMFPTIMTEHGRLGTLVSGDSLNTYREPISYVSGDYTFYSRGTIDILAVPANWSDKYSWPDYKWSDLAERTSSNVIICNRVGKEFNEKFNGGSCIIDRSMKVWSNGSSFLHETIVGGKIIT